LKIPAIKKGDLSQIHWIDIRDSLLVLTGEAGCIELETEDGVFVLPQSVDDWASLLAPYNFVKTDRNAIVKKNRIVGLDRKRRIVYVGQERQGGPRRLSVSNARWASVQSYVACSDESN
jgi:DNA-binding LytR/AlgR family response regulator